MRGLRLEPKLTECEATEMVDNDGNVKSVADKSLNEGLEMIECEVVQTQKTFKVYRF